MGAHGGELEARWVAVLSAVYRSVDWRRVRGRNPLDVFEHRVRFASYEPTVPRFLDKLMNTLGLQAPIVVADVLDDIEYLRSREAEALRFLRGNLKLLVYLAYADARRRREERRRQRQQRPAEARENREGGGWW